MRKRKGPNKTDDLVLATESGDVELVAKPVDEKFTKAVYPPEDFNGTSQSDEEIVAHIFVNN